MRYKVTLAYNGGNYVGFQSQINGIAIQDVIEEAIFKIFNARLRIIMASRTDASVHARGQVFHFDIEKEMDPYKLKGAMNALLPKDIHIIQVDQVDESFHARFSVKQKTYRYLINNGEYDVFLEGFAYQCRFPLDVEIMKDAAKLFLGKHDFSSFNTSTYAEKPDQQRTISEFSIEKQNDLIVFTITGDGFLRNMVRIIVGTLVDLGRGLIRKEDIISMLNDPIKATTRRNNVTGSGLYLERIEY